MLDKVEEFNMDKIMEEFESLKKDVERVYRETLKKILEDNASTEYLQNLGLNGRTNLESFKAYVSLVTYKELEPYIYKIIDGDSSLIFTRKLVTTMSLRCVLTAELAQLLRDNKAEVHIAVVEKVTKFNCILNPKLSIQHILPCERMLEKMEELNVDKNLGFNRRTDPKSFKVCVPLVTHKELEPYIYRIIDSDASPSLTGKPVTTMSLSFGTNQGKPKYAPWNDELFETTMKMYQTSFAFRNSLPAIGVIIGGVGERMLEKVEEFNMDKDMEEFESLTKDTERV
ncbi:hypothetical protein RJT34_14259 [Clitoria ternatea]|uniref:Uncharacterized protein n=1 Tax=Clitoria ternatea TaxID=43366 RepID=A0AAN9JQ21_CLITE